MVGTWAIMTLQKGTRLFAGEAVLAVEISYCSFILVSEIDWLLERIGGDEWKGEGETRRVM
jgi:hypothetical protein